MIVNMLCLSVKSAVQYHKVRGKLRWCMGDLIVYHQANGMLVKPIISIKITVHANHEEKLIIFNLD